MIDKMTLSNQAAAIRKQLGEDPASPINVFSLAQTIDKLTIVLYLYNPQI